MNHILQQNTKSIGTGIGLSMVHQIITKHHNATIRVINETYEYETKSYIGACFKIEFESSKNKVR